MDKPSLLNAIEALKTATGVNSVTPEVLASIYENIILILEENIDGKYSEFSSLKSSFNNFLSSADTSNSTINRWKEIEVFLKGITDTQTLTGLLEALRTDLQAYIDGNTTLINKETTNRQNDTTGIKNTMVKSCVSNNEEFNDVVKELYFDKWVDTSKISTIGFKRNGIAGGSIVWEMYTIDTNGKSSWASFGKNAETDDVNVATIGAQEGHFLYGQGVTVYAVIDWSKVPNNDGVGGETKHFSVNGKMLASINNAKYFPKISECLANHKYTHSPIANSIIKELYFENLTKNGAPSDYEFKKFFSLQRIDRNKPSDAGTSTNVWSLVFIVKNPDVDTSISGVKADNHFYKTVTVSPESDIVTKMSMTTTLKYPNSEGVLTNYVFSATVYAVIDWSKLKSGEANTIIAPLLSGCLDVRNSPIIYNYIENEKLRTQLAQLTTSINTTSEE